MLNPFSLLVVSVLVNSCNGYIQSITDNYTEPEAKPFKEMAMVEEKAMPAADTALHISAFIRDMYQDKSGNLWFGTYTNGVTKYDGKKMSLLEKKTGFIDNIVRDMVEDADGNLWFATNGGVCMYDPSVTLKSGGQSFTRYQVKDGLGSDDVWSILIDNNGKLWFGTGKGVSVLDLSAKHGKGEKAIVDFPIQTSETCSFPGAYPAPKLISSIYQDKAGNIWFGSNGSGVFVYDGKTVSNYTVKDGLCDNFVQSILEDKYGDIWFSSRFGGVSRFGRPAIPGIGSKTFTNFTMKDGLSSNFIWTIFEDKKGNLWFATAGGGVDLYNPAIPFGADDKRITNFTKEDGLAANYVQSILEDKAGNMWFGTANGVSRFNPSASLNSGEKSFISFPSYSDGC